MPNSVSLHIQINDVRGLIWALAIIKAGNSPVFSPLDPFGGVKNSVAQWDVKLWDLPIVDDESLGGFFEGSLVVQDVVM